jgi:S-adenosylmethionine synthetase
VAKRRDYLFTSESVSEGHPDKVCDRISDAVVDLYMAADPHSRVAIETLVTTNRIVMAGEVRGPESVTSALIEDAARRAVREIGYEQKGFHWKNAEFQFYVHEQSADIAMGVGRARRDREGRGRRRPGHHVRLCLPRNRAVDAGADLLRPPHPA